MLTPEDIKLMLEVLPSREDVKLDLEELENKLSAKIDNLTNMVDSFSKENLKQSQENTVQGHRITRAENQIKILADKAEVKLEY